MEKTSREFKLVPTAETNMFVKRLGLISKESEGEHRVMYDAEKVEGLLSEVENKSLVRFTYLLFSSNPYFVNITDVPLEGISEVFYFTNNITHPGKEDTLIHAGEFASIKDRFTLRTSIDINGGDKEKLIELKNDQQKIVFSKMVAAGEKIVLTNQHAPVGKYELFENGKLQSSFVLFTDVPVVKPIAIIEISYSGKIKDEFIAGVHDNDIPFYSYKVEFSSRNTIWKYFFVAKYHSNLKNTTIDSGGESCKFKGPEMITMKSGEDAAVFVADTPLPLKQIQECRFQLKNVRGNSNGKTIVDRLPSPSPEMIKPESRDKNSKVYSEIIVHI